MVFESGRRKEVMERQNLRKCFLEEEWMGWESRSMISRRIYEEGGAFWTEWWRKVMNSYTYLDSSPKRLRR
jgi:hypothetical protein